VAYSIDSSGILDLFRYYPPDVFPTIWTQMEAAAQSGVIFAIDEVYRELEKKDDVAFAWLKARRAIVVELDTQIQQRVATILESILD
jgi:phage gp29-like protein